MGNEGNGHAPVGVEPRQRLLRAMPVVERQPDIGGISTTVLEQPQALLRLLGTATSIPADGAAARVWRRA